jgi:4-amino-4-deoxy-L-arabinose transferase-like glycosyltransferase
MKTLLETVSIHRRDIALLNLAALAVTLLFWAFLSGRWAEDQNFDYLTYYQPVAQRLLDGVGLREESGALAAHYPPGFSILLAGVFGVARLTGMNEELALDIFILICTALSVTLVYMIALRVFGNRTALLAGLLWLTYPFSLWLTKQPNSETPFLVLLLATIYSFVSFRQEEPELRSTGWPALRTGLLAGLTSLVRPVAVVLSVVLATVLLYSRRDLRTKQRLRAAALLLAGNLLAVMPWEFWVWQDSGQWIVLARSSSNSLMDGMTFAAHPKGSGVLLPVRPNVRELMLRADADHERVETLGGIARFLWKEARRDPATVLEFLFLKARRIWYGTHGQWLETFSACVQIL